MQIKFTKGDNFVKKLDSAHGDNLFVGIKILTIDEEKDTLNALAYGGHFGEVWEVIPLQISILYDVIREEDWKYVGNIETTKRFS